MNEYFLGLIVFAFVGSMILALAPTGISRIYIRLLCGLCSIGCIAFPLMSLANGDMLSSGDFAAIFEPSDKIDEEIAEIYNNSLNDATLSSVEESLEGEIISRLSAEYEDIDIEILISNRENTVSVDKIRVYIYPSGYALSPDKISEICQERLSCECEFVYK